MATRSEHALLQQEMLALLSVDERTRHERFHRREDRERFVIGRGMLRCFLGTCLGLAPERVAFGYGPFGKPHLAPGPSETSLRFNLAHSGDLVLLALSIHAEVGVDLEQVRPETEWTDIVPRVLSEEQRNEWARLSPAERSQCFYRAWTRREAVLKASGVGLGGESAAGTPRSAAIHDLDLPDGYFGAVALLG